MYLGDTPEGAVAESLGNYARWTPAVLEPPPAAPPTSVLALARYAVDADVLDLDDPYVLRDWGLRPSSVVSRDRTVTQQWARAIYEAEAGAGVSWWSYRDPRWASLGLWDHGLVSLVGEPEPLTLAHSAVMDASRVISRVIEP